MFNMNNNMMNNNFINNKIIKNFINLKPKRK